ncbi:MAG: queC 3 [Chloroflexi bacterium]|nr:queC 3 [Chloroflexota bacterium]
MPSNPLDPSRVCVLVSGGVDSAVLVWHMLQQGSEVQPVYVQTGMVWESVEREWLNRFLDAIPDPRLRPVRSLSIPLGDVYHDHWSVGTEDAPSYDAPDEAVYLPGRNIILMAKTAVYCALNDIQRIAIGVLAGNPFPDATEGFFLGLGQAMGAGMGTQIRIERPFGGMHKVDVVRLGASLPLHLTFSCIRPVGQQHCGNCNKCAERQRGFIDAHVPDGTTYARQQGLA